MLILGIAMKYQVEELAKQTESFIVCHINADTAVNILIAADSLSANTIRAGSMNYILKHWNIMAR